MLTIDVKVNGRLIGSASVQNLSDGDPISDYAVDAMSDQSKFTGAPALKNTFKLLRHRRKQSAWALVAKIAKRLAERERLWVQGDR